MRDNFNIKNNVVVITGAAGLLAKQHIEVVIENKAIGILIDIDKKKIEKVKKYYLNQYEDINLEFFVGDITDEKFIDKIRKKIIKKYGKIDVLINNAAVDYPPSKSKKNCLY